MKKFTRALFLVLAVLTALTVCVSAYDLSTFKDYKADHWANTALSHAVDNKLLGGYEDNTIRADRDITRAEMATVINRAFGATIPAPISQFKDIKTTDWFFNEIAKAVQMQTFGGTGDKMEAGRVIYREEAMAVIARALVLKDGDAKVLEKYPDHKSVSEWAKGPLAALVSRAYVNGTDKNMVEPRSYVTRAQFAQIMYNIFSDYIQVPGTYSVNAERSLMINVPNVTLRNCTVKGDLVLGDGVGGGYAKIENVKVTGRILIRGGNKVTFKNVTTGEGIVVKNVNGTVNFQNYKTEDIFDGITAYTTVTYLQKGGYIPSAPSAKYYTVKFYDAEGAIWDEQSVRSGSDADTPANPGKASDDLYTYTFVGWNKAYTNVRENLDIYPIFSHADRIYTITVILNNGDPDATINVKFTDTIEDKLPTGITNGTKPFIAWVANTSPETEITSSTTYEDIKGATAIKAVWKDKFTVTWKNWNGTELDSTEVEYGETIPSYSGATPTKPSTEQVTYEFAGWTESVDFATGNVTYTAKFDTKARKYTITWKNEDGSILDTDEVEYGKTPVYTGVIPTKAADAQYTYTFDKWTPDIVAVTGDATYTATYTKTVNSYTVTWQNWDGSVLETDTVPYGTVPTYDGAIPTRDGDAEKTYIFDKWAPEIEKVTGDAFYTATFTTSTNEYTVTWHNYDGSLLETDTVKYGDTPTYDGAIPTRDATAQYTYTFEKWTPDVVAVTGNASYKAVFTETLNSYTVTWTNWDGAVLETDTVKYGDTPTYDGETPTRAATEDYIYTFAGWDPLVVIVTGEATYKATYTEEEIYTVTFYDNSGNFIDKVTNLSAGDTVSTFPVYSKAKNGYRTGAGFTHSAVDYIYDETYIHKIEHTWSYDDGNGEFVQFTNKTEVYSDMDVYAYYKKATLNVFVERFKDKNNGEFTFFTFYDESRLVDSFKDVLWNNRLSVIQAIDITNAEEKLFAKLEEKGFITSDREILNQEALIKLVTLIGDENLDEFVKTEAEKNVTVDIMNDFLESYIHDHPDEATKLLQDFLAAASQNDIETIFKPAVKAFLEHDQHLLEEEIKLYIDELTNDEIKDLVKEEPEFVKAFIKDHPEIVKDFIKSDSTELREFIKDNPSDLKEFVKDNPDELKEFIKDNPSDLKEFIKDNPDELKVFIKNNPTKLKDFIKSSPAKLKDYIKNNTDKLEEYIENNPAKLKDFIKNNTDKLEEYIENNPAKLKDFIKNNTDKLEDYIANNPDELKDYVKNNSVDKVKNFAIGNKTLVKNELYDFIVDLNNIAFLKDKLAEDEVYKNYVVGAVMDKLNELSMIANATNNWSEVNALIDKFDTTVPDISSSIDIAMWEATIANSILNAANRDLVIDEITSELELNNAEGLASRTEVADIIYGNNDLYEDAVTMAVTDALFLEATIDKAIADNAFYTDVISSALADDAFLNDAIDVAIGDATFLADMIAEAIANDTFLTDMIETAVGDATFLADMIAEAVADDTFLTDMIETAVGDATFLADMIAEAVADDAFLNDMINTAIADDVFLNDMINTAIADDTFLTDMINTAILDDTFLEDMIDIAVANDTFLDDMIENALADDTFINNALDSAIANDAFLDKAIDAALNNANFLETLMNTTVAETAIDEILATKGVPGGDFEKAVDSVIRTMTKPENKANTINKIIDIIFDEDHKDQLNKAIDIVVHDIAESDDSGIRSLIEEISQDVVKYLDKHPDKKQQLIEMVVEDLYRDTIDLFVYQLRNEEKFTVHDNLTSLIAGAMYKKYNGMTVEGFINEVKLPDAFDKVLSNDAIRAIIEDIYNNSLQPYLAQLKAAQDGYNADPTQTYYVDTFVTVKVDPIDDLVYPLYDEFKPILDEKLDDKHFYKDNPYAVALVDFLSPDVLLNKMATGYDEEIYSGYTVPTAEELYTIVYTAVILADDAGKWYHDNVDKDRVDAAIDRFEDKILEYINTFIGFINEYKESGEIPNVDDLPDDKIKELLEKYDIQGIYDRNAQIQAIKDRIVANDRFNSVIDKFYSSKFNRELTGEDYDKAKKVLDFFFDNYQNEEFTVDKLFDITLPEKFAEYKIDEDTYKVEFRGNTAEFIREIVKNR